MRKSLTKKYQAMEVYIKKKKHTSPKQKAQGIAKEQKQNKTISYQVTVNLAEK